MINQIYIQVLSPFSNQYENLVFISFNKNSDFTTVPSLTSHQIISVYIDKLDSPKNM